MANPPDTIYLQRPPDDGLDWWTETTWCVDKINEDDVEYVRAISPFEDDGVAPEDRNVDVLDVINRLDRIMRDQAFPIEQRIHDLEHIAAFALRFRDRLRKTR